MVNASINWASLCGTLIVVGFFEMLLDSVESIDMTDSLLIENRLSC